MKEEEGVRKEDEVGEDEAKFRKREKYSNSNKKIMKERRNQLRKTIKDEE